MSKDVDRSFCYVRAVNGATLAFVVLFGIKGAAEGAASSVPFPERILHFAVPMLVIGALFWLFAFLTALAPFAATYALARRLGIRSILYYAICGALTGLMLTPVFVGVRPQMVGQEYTAFWQDCLTWGPILIASGLCGALAFWHRTGRHPAHAGRGAQ